MRRFISFCWISGAPRDLVSAVAIVFPVPFSFLEYTFELQPFCHLSLGAGIDQKTTATNLKMVLKGNALYVRALIGGSLGFVTFGWDAGVLGGVLLTEEFQTAMGVSLCLFSIFGQLPANISIVDAKHEYDFHDNVHLLAGIMAWLYDNFRLWNEVGEKTVDHLRMFGPGRGHNHFGFGLQLWSTYRR